MFGADAAAHIRASKVSHEDKCSARKAYYMCGKILLNMIHLVQGCVTRVSAMIHAYKVIRIKALHCLDKKKKSVPGFNKANMQECYESIR